MTGSDRSAIEILGVRVDRISVESLHRRIERIVAEGRHELILNVNVNCLNLAHDRQWMRNLLNAAEIVFCDGAGVMLGARILGYRIPERITYADWMWQLTSFAEEKGLTFFFLGGAPGVAEAAADRLLERHPNLRILGSHHGYFDKRIGSSENSAVVSMINDLRPNLLVLAFGMPLQERWLHENWNGVQANAALTGGAVFDFVSGRSRRGPTWMTQHGLEWLARLLLEPRRLWRRYLLGNPLFLWRVLRERSRKKTQAGGQPT